MSESTTVKRHGNVGRTREYNAKCDNCSKDSTRTEVRVKSVIFRDVGAKGKLIRTRTLAWICDECMTSDPDFDRPKITASPGIKKAGSYVQPNETDTDTEGTQEKMDTSSLLLLGVGRYQLRLFRSDDFDAELPPEERSHVLGVYPALKSMNLSIMTEEELDALKLFFNEAIEAARPLVRKLDADAQAAKEKGDMTYKRLWRPSPMYFDNRTAGERSFLTVCERCSRTLKSGETPPLCADCEMGSE